MCINYNLCIFMSTWLNDLTEVEMTSVNIDRAPMSLLA